MPQFDLFIWFSLSFWTIFFFELVYFFIIYYIAAPFSNLQKTLIKLYILKNKNKKTRTNTCLKNYYVVVFFNKSLPFLIYV